MTENPVFPFIFHPGALIESFIDALDGLAIQSKAQLKLKFSMVEAIVKSELNRIFSAPNQSRCRKETVLGFGNWCFEEEEQDVSAQFLKTLNIHFVNLEKYCNVFAVLGFNSAKNDSSFIKSYLLLLLVDERSI